MTFVDGKHKFTHNNGCPLCQREILTIVQDYYKTLIVRLTLAYSTRL